MLEAVKRAAAGALAPDFALATFHAATLPGITYLGCFAVFQMDRKVGHLALADLAMTDLLSVTILATVVGTELTGTVLTYANRRLAAAPSEWEAAKP
jgi:hypothetical protein